MSAEALIPSNPAELVSTANKLWARTTSAANVAGAVAKAFPTRFEPGSGRTNLGLCCWLVRWALIETSYSLQRIKDNGSDNLPLAPDIYVSTCDEQQQRLLACLATAMAVCELMKPTRFNYERLLLAGILPDLDEQLALLAAIRAAAKSANAW